MFLQLALCSTCIAVNREELSDWTVADDLFKLSRSHLNVSEPLSQRHSDKLSEQKRSKTSFKNQTVRT